MQVVILLAAGVVAVTLFRRLRLGSVLGYLAAGVLVGPSVLGVVSEPQAILHVAELGVVLLLFVIGLEMDPDRLWALRRQIFGLGVAQVGICGALLSGVGLLFGLPGPVAFVAAMGFVLSSTAIVAQIMEERGSTAKPHGQRVVSILLLEDLAIVPLLAVVAFIGPYDTGDHGSRLVDIAIAVGALAGLVAAGIWLLNPLFRLLAASRAREVMTAAALLVVLGAALLLEMGGLSMALGAFVAGVLLSTSSFRHQLEADIEPFRGLLLGLFFLSVGMALDLSIVLAHWATVLASVAVYMAVKSAAIYAIARATGRSHVEGLFRAALMAQGGEFAFVLYSAAQDAGVVDGETNGVLSATVILSMVATPFLVMLMSRLVRRHKAKAPASMDGVESARGLDGNVLMIGFGRFGQVASQQLLARGLRISILDIDTEMIRSAEEFGFKVYFGDGRRLDVLEASGAASADVLCICVDSPQTTDRIVALARHAFPSTRIMARAFDREHAVKLIDAGVEYQVRETFESAMAFGHAALLLLQVPPGEAREINDDIRRRDQQRLQLELAAGDSRAGIPLMFGNVDRPRPRPTPLLPARRDPLEGDGAAPQGRDGASVRRGLAATSSNAREARADADARREHSTAGDDDAR
ncbi:monovalent cation:proton antiporter-2 (CPA2) family protein [Coralloluteibacterium stylophorae]|uniref:Monovalent cation:proton antiporter-2 (CPA2) family protein n=1 Tax=Coralloluteibacterium stylophorae TaxID=1776034 RepID=A0A8J7VSF1_9GAMM|nr:monovalent cation:proton antiporter-2 (CPA2) family protein [Coralloluteibacterium stylophorae]MBS7455534.1 monovalent cation:proton antiporter-2 (CPA2) family protein [Coralloluteibacterium stylophorae]